MIDCNAFPQMIKEIILKNSHRKIKYKYFRMHQVINNLSQTLLQNYSIRLQNKQTVHYVKRHLRINSFEKHFDIMYNRRSL